VLASTTRHDAGGSSATRPTVAGVSAWPWHDEQQCNGDTTGGSTPQQDTEQLDTISDGESPFFLFFLFLALGFVCSKAMA